MSIRSVIRKPFFAGFLVFGILLLLTQFLSYERYLSAKARETRELVDQAHAARDRLQRTIGNCMSSAQTLAFITERYGIPADFDSIAAPLMRANPLIDIIELLQGSVITHVHPLKGNETVVGFDIMTNPLAYTGAVRAINNRSFFFAGPVKLKQGGVAVIGRQPIFKEQKFWGFSAVIVGLPNFLKAAGIDTRRREFDYQLSQVNEADGSETFFLPEQGLLEEKSFTTIEIPDTEWRLYVISTNPYNIFINALLLSLIGILLSATAGFFAWYQARQPEKLSEMVAIKTSQLIATEKSHRATLERISDAFIALDTAWLCTYMNYKAGEIFGRDPQAMIGKHLWTEFPEGIGHPFFQAVHRSMEEQKFIFLEEYYPSYRSWFESYIYPSPNGLSIFIRDVTEQQKAKEKLAASEKYFRALIEKSSDAIMLINADGKVVYQSPSTQRITGYSLDEMQAMEVIKLIHPTDRDEASLAFRSLWQTPGAFAQRSHRFKHKDGNYIWLEGTYSNLLNDEHIKAVVYNYHDITERKKAEQQILIEKDLSESIINTLPGVFYLYDQEGKFFRWNKNFETVSGYTAEEMSVRHPLDFFEGDEKLLIKNKIDTTFQEGKAEVEAHFFTKNKDRLLYYFTGHRAHFDGVPYLIGVGIDITLLNEAQKQLRKSNEDILRLNTHLQTLVGQLQSRNKDLQQFSYIVSHNLRSPIAKILGLASIIGDDSQEDKLLLKKIVAETEHLDTVVKDINVIVAARDLSEKMENVSFEAELETIKTILEQQIVASGVKIYSDFAVEGLITIKSYLYSIMYNLISNAIKYRRRDGIAEITISSQMAGSMVCFLVKDNGLGINLAKNGEKIFGLYKRFHPEAAEGKGIGLSLVKTQVDALGGRIEVESNLNQGSTFKIYLPNK